jgi:hypothetical protein
MKQLCLAIAALGLAGCASNGGPVARYDIAGLPAAPTSRAVESADFMVHIPEWAGAIKNARQYNDANVVRQTIVFAGGTLGDHMVEAAVGMRDDNPRGLPALHNPSEIEIADELRAKFPGVPMHILAEPINDEGGPYRLAIGRAADGARCLYAWRWTDDLRVTSDPSGIASVAAMFSHRMRPASLRVRLCTKYVTLDDLASLAQQIRFVSTPDMDRILGERPPPAEGAAMHLDAALGPSLESVVPQPIVREDAPRRHREAVTPARPRQRIVHHRRRPVNVGGDSSPGFQTPTGAKYLAPLPIAGQLAPGTPTGSPVSGNPLGQGLNLPAAAFRGPSGAVNSGAGNAQARGS